MRIVKDRSGSFLACIYLAGILFLAQACQALPVDQDAALRPSEPASFWLSGSGSQNELDNAKLLELLKRVGPNMRSSSNYYDFEDIGLNESMIGWKSLHNQAQSFADSQVHFYGPKLEHLLREANVSAGCLMSLNETLKSLERLDSWAVQSKFSEKNSSDQFRARQLIMQMKFLSVELDRQLSAHQTIRWPAH